MFQTTNQYVYIFICMCVCVPVSSASKPYPPLQGPDFNSMVIWSKHGKKLVSQLLEAYTSAKMLQESWPHKSRIRPSLKSTDPSNLISALHPLSDQPWNSFGSGRCFWDTAIWANKKPPGSACRDRWDWDMWCKALGPWRCLEPWLQRRWLRWGFHPAGLVKHHAMAMVVKWTRFYCHHLPSCFFQLSTTWVTLNPAFVDESPQKSSPHWDHQKVEQPHRESPSSSPCSSYCARWAHSCD